MEMEANTTVLTGDVPLGWHLFFSQKCYSVVVEDLNFLDGECMKLLFSKVLSYAIIIITSLFVKMPQIFKILKNESAQGISFLSQVFILITSAGNVAYSLAKDYPVSTWAESGVLTIQVLLIGVLILLYTDCQRQAVVYVAVFLCVMALMLTPFTPMWLHVVVQVLSVPFSGISKVIQIWTNIKNGGTGQLSSTSTYMQNFRSVGRLYSTLTELGDPLRIAVYGQASALNFVLSFQMIYYQKLKESDKKRS